MRPRRRPSANESAAPDAMTATSTAFICAWATFCRPMAPTTSGKEEELLRLGAPPRPSPAGQDEDDQDDGDGIVVKFMSDRQLVGGLAAHLGPADGQPAGAGDGHGQGHEDQGVGERVDRDPVGEIQWPSWVVYQWLAP